MTLIWSCLDQTESARNAICALKEKIKFYKLTREDIKRIRQSFQAEHHKIPPALSESKTRGEETERERENIWEKVIAKK